MGLYSLLTVVFAYCSMVYELFLAQTLTSVLGGTNVRYAMTIGLYITSMGIGAWLLRSLLNGHSRDHQNHNAASKAAPRWSAGQSAPQLLVKVELTLMTLGLLAVPYVLGVDRLVSALEAWMVGMEHVPWVTSLRAVSELLAWGAFHLPIVLIGILSGLELPLLMKCAQDRRQRIPSVTPAGSGPGAGVFQADILAWDYVGTVLGALLFPFLLLPWLGVFGVAFVTVVINASATLIFLFLWSHGSRESLGAGRIRSMSWRPLAACTFFLCLAAAGLSHSDGIRTFFVNRIYLAPRADVSDTSSSVEAPSEEASSPKELRP